MFDYIHQGCQQTATNTDFIPQNLNGAASYVAVRTATVSPNRTGTRLTVVLEHLDGCSWQSGPQDERCVIELIAQNQATLKISREKILPSNFQCQGRIVLWDFSQEIKLHVLHNILSVTINDKTYSDGTWCLVCIALYQSNSLLGT